VKLYEVLQALEEGKKIKSKRFGIIYFNDGRLWYEQSVFAEPITGLPSNLLFANDWEIAENLLKVENNTSEIIADLQDQINYLKKEVNILKANVQNDTKKRLFLDTKRGVGIRD